MSAHKADILVVDDTPAYLEALRDMLTGEGYKVRPVTNGKLALGAVEHLAPDLILLDINMPTMNGFETCERLKADGRFADIPVIFLSSLTDTDDKVKAFAAGGVDYVTKPFEAAEVVARVETHLRLRRLQKQLSQQFEDLKKLESLRDSLTHMIVHDLRAPLQAILGNLQLLEMDMQGGAAATDLKAALRGTHTLIQMISSLLDVNKLEAGEMPLKRTDADLGAAVAEALEGMGGLTRDRSLTFAKPDPPVIALFDREIIIRVITNLVANALKFTPLKGSVSVRVVRRSGKPAVEVVDSGPGIPPEYHTRIFEKFGQVSGADKKRHSTGLGLAFCKLAVDAHAGEIGVDSAVGKGSTFWFCLPPRA